MRQEVLNRLELINNGDRREGYFFDLRCSTKAATYCS